MAARATYLTSGQATGCGDGRESIDNVGAVPREVSTDGGYYSVRAADEVYALGVDPFVAPEQTRHGRVLPRVKGVVPQCCPHQRSPATRRSRECEPAKLIDANRQE